MSTTFRQLAETAQQIAERRSTDNKITVFAEFLKKIEADENLNLAAQFLGEGAFSSISGKKVSVGSHTYSTCAAEFCEIDYKKVFKPCRTVLKSASETIEKLMDNIDAARRKRTPGRLSLTEVNEIYADLCAASSVVEKQNFLRKAWTKMTPVEIKYFIRIMGRESLGIGLDTTTIGEAIALAFGRDTDEVQSAIVITGCIGRVAVLSKNDALGQATFKLFHPLSFMLASPVDNRSVENPESYHVEEKLDGMRCQAHISRQRVELYSRDLSNVTHFFPEIIRFFQSRNLRDLVLDGEICVYRDKTILPSRLLQKKVGKKKPEKNVREPYSVLFIAHDVLYHDEHSLFKHTLQRRRNLLEKLSHSYDFPVTNRFEVRDHDHLDELLNRAVARGNEGLILKKKESTYDYGRRGKSWLKIKRPGSTLYTVVMYAHTGSENRGGYYQDFTLGVSVKEDRRYEEEFIPIGKISGGYTNEDIKLLNERVRELTVERYGPTRALVPGIVVELEFDDIRLNRRTKANYTLHLPRFKSIRRDLSPQHTATLKDVERIYEERLNRDRQKQDKDPSFYTIHPNPDRSV